MIGLWVGRFAGDKRLTLWHLVESEIADRKVVRCGRQLREREGTVLAPVISPLTEGEACYACRRRVALDG